MIRTICHSLKFPQAEYWSVASISRSTASTSSSKSNKGMPLHISKTKEEVNLLKCLETSCVHSTAVFLFDPALISSVVLQRANSILSVVDYSLNFWIIKHLGAEDISIISHPRNKRGTAPKPPSPQPIFPNMADNISDSEFLARLAGETNHTLLSPNTDGNISDPEFLVHLSGEMDQTLEVMK